MTKPTMPTPDTTVYGKDRFTAPKHAYFHENVLALNKAWAAYHEAAIAAAVAKERAWWLEHTKAVHGKISEMVRSARGAAHD